MLSLAVISACLERETSGFGLTSHQTSARLRRFLARYRDEGAAKGWPEPPLSIFCIAATERVRAAHQKGGIAAQGSVNTHGDGFPTHTSIKGIGGLGRSAIVTNVAISMPRNYIQLTKVVVSCGTDASSSRAGHQLPSLKFSCHALLQGLMFGKVADAIVHDHIACDVYSPICGGRVHR